MGLEDGQRLYDARHTTTAARTDEDVARLEAMFGNGVAVGREEYKARHGDRHAAELLQEHADAIKALQGAMPRGESNDHAQ